MSNAFVGFVFDASLSLDDIYQASGVSLRRPQAGHSGPTLASVNE